MNKLKALPLLSLPVFFVLPPAPVPALKDSVPLASPASNAASPVSVSDRLSQALLFVADKESADAAAPQVAALLKGVDPSAVRVDAFDLALMQAMRCFGSLELQEALKPVIPMLDAAQFPQLAPYKQYVEEMWRYMDDISETLERIDSKESADAAAPLLEEFPPFMLSLLEKVNHFPLTDEASARAVAYLGRPVTRVKAGRLLTAWGQLQLRSEDYYGSARFQKTLDGLSEVLQNLGVEVEADGVGVLTQISHAYVPVFREWIALARTVRDVESADAAAPGFQALREKMDALASGVAGEEYEKEMFHICPEAELLVHICDHISHYFSAGIRPPFYGSARLRDALRHED